VADMLDDGAARPTTFSCFEKQYDRVSLPGRTLIHCRWQADRAEARDLEAQYVTG